jgi:hypothetical protein
MNKYLFINNYLSVLELYLCKKQTKELSYLPNTFKTLNYEQIIKYCDSNDDSLIIYIMCNSQAR